MGSSYNPIQEQICASLHGLRQCTTVVYPFRLAADAEAGSRFPALDFCYKKIFSSKIHLKDFEVLDRGR